MATVKLTNVKKVYGKDTVAVQDFNLDIADKEFIVFVGPSGCGKSTTLRMIAGLEDISDGTVEIDGVVVNDLQPRDRDIAMVFQNYALYPHLTVFENMAFSLRLKKVPQDVVYEKVTQAAEILGITEYLMRKPRALSGGQRQRMEIARVLAQEPTVIIMDEATSALDAKTEYDVVKAIKDRGITCIVVAHRLSTIRDCDEIIVMNHGEVVERGTHEELLASDGLYTRLYKAQFKSLE